MRDNTLGCGAWACLALLAACGDDGGSAVDAAPPAPDATGCHELAQSAADVVQQRVAEAAPVGTGGTVADGLYHQVSDTIYTGVGGATGPTGYTSALTSSCVALHCRVAIDETNGTSPLQTFDLTIDGTSLTLDLTCPDDNSVDTTFTGGGGTVAIYEALLTGVRERVYELE